jgi:hypothetical protein
MDEKYVLNWLGFQILLIDYDYNIKKLKHIDTY